MRVYHDTNSYIKMVDEIHGGLFDYSKTEFTKMGSVITVICHKHGEFYPQADNHKKTGCPKCYDERRGDTLRMSAEEFATRLAAFNPMNTLVGKWVDASTPTLMSCELHGEFTGVPTRALTYFNSCKLCENLRKTAGNIVKAADNISAAVAALPKGITVVTANPGWTTTTVFHCAEHGEFTSELGRAMGMQYVCNECAKSHWQGVQRVSYTDYAQVIAELFPNPLNAITLVESSYSENVGTKLVHLHCADHGEFYRNRDTINNGRLGTPCPYCKVHGLSTPECEVIAFVRDLASCTQGDRTQIAPKELDCWVPSHRLAIEFCGLYWHRASKLGTAYHLDKLNACLAKGITLIQVFEDEWANHRTICESIIRNRLGLSAQLKYHARKLSLVECVFSDVKDFLVVNHIQGFTPAQKYYALRDAEGIKAVASFSFNRLKQDGKWELVRYCSVLNSTVVGGLSKLVTHFMRTNGVPSLISYCCRRWFTGKGYESAGFILIGETQPSYFYTKAMLRLSRYSAKKHKLAKLLPGFDPHLTETANMEKAGFDKIYDCGNLVYEFNL